MVLVSLLTDITSRREGADGDWQMSEVGTNRTNRAGLLISVDRGKPEVSGRRSKQRD